MIPETWSMTDKHFSHFGPFFALLHSPPLQQPRESKFKKNGNKKPGDIVILLKCTINDSHMIYGSRDMKCTRCKFSRYRTSTSRKYHSSFSSQQLLSLSCIQSLQVKQSVIVSNNLVYTNCLMSCQTTQAQNIIELLPSAQSSF